MDECDKTTSLSSSKAKESSDTTVAQIQFTSSSTQLSQAELLWNQFVKNITQRQRSGVGMCKYPNPDVPEFYPRNMKIVCTEVSHETGDSSANETHPTATCTTINTLQQLNITRMSQECVAVQPNTLIEAPEAVHGIAHYYWTFHDPNSVAFDRPSKRVPHAIKLNLEAGKKTELEPPGDNEATTRSLQDLRLELRTKNQQLVHMNNVVKALLEEIYKINELLMRNRIKEQGTRDIHSSIEQYLKSASELGYPCDDCCSRLKEFVGHVSKQLERKIVKQHGQYRSTFVDCILSVIENSLHTLIHCSQIDEDTKKKLRKQDAYTQTNYFYYCEEPFANSYVSSRADSRNKGKQQMTRVYRNRNLYKYDVAKGTGNSSGWYPPRNNRIWRTNASSFPQHRRRAPMATKVTPTPSSSDVENSKNPVQLIHQRFKNLNCRLEGIPEKKLVKFSYIVDNKEYSAIATTKKEAQYLCAWHMLNSCKE